MVAAELPREPQKAPLHLFSAAPELVEFGGRAYQRHSDQTSGLLVQLFEGLHAERFPMPYTMEDFQRQFVKEHFPKLTPEEREEVLQALPPEARLAGLPPEARLAGLSPETRLAGLPPETRLAGLSEAQIRRLLDEFAAGRASRPRRKRGPERRSPDAPGGKNPKKGGKLK